MAFGCKRGKKEQKEIRMETRKGHLKKKTLSFCVGISVSKYDIVLINISLFSVMVSICCKERLLGSLVLAILTFECMNKT